MKTIILNGSGTAGKGQFYSYCFDWITKNIGNGKCYKTSIIDPIKEFAATIGWKGGKSDGDRKFLADLKDLIEIYNNLPRNFIKTEIEAAQQNNCSYIFIDMREPNDIDWVKENFDNVITVLIDREETHRTYGNSADDGVKNYSYDYIIDNNGSLKELEYAVITFMEDIL